MKSPLTRRLRKQTPINKSDTIYGPLTNNFYIYEMDRKKTKR